MATSSSSSAPKPEKKSIPLQFADDELGFIQSLAAQIVSTSSKQPPINSKFLITHTHTAVRRALRIPCIRSDPKLYPPSSIALCALAYFSQTSLTQVHHYYSGQFHANSSPITFSTLHQIYQDAWKPIISSLRLPSSIKQPVDCPSDEKGLQASNRSGPSTTFKTTPKTPKTPKTLKTLKTSKTPKTPKIPTPSTPLFADTHILLVPSPLFSRASANTLSVRAKEKGATTTLLSPGAAGFSEACELSDSIKKKTKNETPYGERVVVVADVALTKRRFQDASQLDCVVPPKWLTDSLKDSRFKPPSFYSVTPRKPILPSVHIPQLHQTPPPNSYQKKRPQPHSENEYSEQYEFEQITDFRAEINVDLNSSQSGKRQKQERSEEIQPGSSFTVTTRLFTTPKKKSLARNDDDEDDDNDKINDEKAIDIDISAKVSDPIERKDCPHTGHESAVKIVENKRSDFGGRWACEIRTGTEQTDFPANNRICDLLSIVQGSYEAKRDSFRSVGYKKAIARLKTLQYEILCMDDVRRLEDEANIGAGMIDKIEEIVRTGRLQQAESVLQDADYEALQTLCGVWGIGPVRGMQLLKEGIQDIQGLRKAVKDKAVTLDRCQRIGLTRYEDLLLKMPRSYVAELEMYVKKVTKSVDTSINATIAGSYLRGKASCGDADILIHGESWRVQAALPKIRQAMKRDRVLTDDLVEGDGKYFGVFRLPGRPHGRIDLFAVPNEEFPYALLTYTGSAVFNMSMRAKARALGYSLSHHTMQKVVRTKSGKSRLEGPIVVNDEKEIFEMLDIRYVVPSQRSIK